MATTKTDSVSSVMSAKVLGVTPKNPLEVALRLMIETHVHHLPVIDGQRCVGLLHETDILWSLWTNGPTEATAAASRRQIGRSVNPDATVAVAAARLSQNGSDAALVTTNGVITATDIVNHLGERAS